MLKRTHGIVLKNTVFGEADLIVTYITPDYGILKVFARSPRKIKSRFGSSLEPLTYSKISFFGKEESNLPRLTQSDIIRPFHSLREDFESLLNISEILELCINFLPEKEPNAGIFKLLLNILLKLESDSDNRLYYLFYKMRFLEIAGYSPRLEACGRCGGTTAGSAPFMKGKSHGIQNLHHNFYVSHGSIICHKCVGDRDEPIKLSSSALRFYKSLLRWNPTALDRINAPEYLVSEIAAVINSHIRYVLGPPKSYNRKAFG
ncbi:MAG: DNA repair protein RecO [Nitrospirae bacterium]|nr:DNA repair protein RecO [Nitrospirota bacterium]